MLAWPRGARYSIQSQFWFYSLALLVPALVFSGLMILRSASFERADVDRQIQDAVNSTAVALDREFAATISTLMALASSPSLSEGELAAFYGQAKAAAEVSGSHFYLTDTKGRQLVNTRVAWGDALPDRSNGNWQDVLKSGKPEVSNLFRGIVAGEPVYAVSVPVKGRGKIAAVLSASILPRRIVEILDNQHLDDGWIVGVTDRSGTIIARSKDSERYLGQPLRGDLWDARDRAGPWRTTNLEGTKVLRATARSRSSDWLVATTVPISVANRELTRSWLFVSTMAAGFSILSALLTFSFGRRISGPVRQLVAGADALGRGEEIPPIDSSISEVCDVAHAISRAAATRLWMERSLRESESRLRQVLDNLFAFVGILDLRGTLIEANKAPLEAAALTRDDVIGKPFWDCYWWAASPANQTKLKESFERAKTGQTVRYDVDIRVRDNQQITIDFQMAPLFDADGRVILVIPSGIDITERMRREEHIHLLMRELTHRSKNLLAVIQAMARQSKVGSSTVDEFEARFSARLQALAASHDLLVQRDWHGVALDDLVTSQLGHYLDRHMSQIAINGPQLLVTPEAAQNIGLAVHELSTNAAKYGALSVPEGRIEVRWECTPADEGERNLRLTWRETGGPAVVAPTHRGFGQLVIEEIAPRALHGTARLEFAPMGVRWTLDILATHALTPKETPAPGVGEPHVESRSNSSCWSLPAATRIDEESLIAAGKKKNAL
jgi:PAS domain S-box-containing protein